MPKKCGNWGDRGIFAMFQLLLACSRLEIMQLFRKKVMMLVGKSKLPPEGDQYGCGSSLNVPPKEISVWSVSGHFL